MGDERREAFERLCRDEYAHVVRTAYLITGDREEAVDVAQEAFARAYERWRLVSKMDRPGAWVTRVAANLAISWRRRHRMRARGAERPTSDVLEELQPPDADLIAALRSLTPSQRAAVVLRFYADQSIEQTAATLGKRPGTVRALTSQATARMREFLVERETNDDARH